MQFVQQSLVANVEFTRHLFAIPVGLLKRLEHQLLHRFVGSLGGDLLERDLLPWKALLCTRRLQLRECSIHVPTSKGQDADRGFSTQPRSLNG